MSKGLRITLAGVLLLTTAFTALVLTTPHARALDNTFFDNSDTYDHSTGAATAVKLRVGNSANVKKANTYAAAYFSSPTGNSVVIYNLNYCNGNSYDDFAESTSGYNAIGNGTAVTTYQITGHAGNIYGVKGRNCEQNLTVALGTLPLDPATGLYKATFKAIYMANNAGVVGNYFKLAATAPPGERAWIAQLAAPDANSFGNAVTFRKYNNTNDLTDYSIKFGADCSVPAAGKIDTLNYYDLDNSSAAPQSAGKYITMSLERINKLDATDVQYWHANAALTGGSWANSYDTWQPANGNNISGSTKGIRFNPEYRYIWIMHNVRTNNTIQFSSPYDGIFYVKSCNWQFSASSYAQNVTQSRNGPVSGSVTAAPGDTVQFVHTVKNTGSVASGTFNTREQFTNTAGAKSGAACAAGVTGTGPPPAQTLCIPATGTQNGNAALGGGASRQIIPAGATRFTIPANATNGTTYCQLISVTPKSYLDTSVIYSTRACVTVVTNPVITACTASHQPSILGTHESGGNLQLAITGVPDGPITIRVDGYGAGGAAITLTGTITGGRASFTLPTADHAGQFAVTVISPTALDCGAVTVYDLPYLSVFGSSMRAGGDFSGGSCTGGGLLASWFNNNTVGNGYGTSATLSTLALQNIVGAASYQATRTNKPTGATFANNVPANITADAHNPKLGGVYGASSQYCQTAPQMPSNTPVYNSGTINASTTVGAIQHDGDLRINGGTIPSSQNGSVFVTNGDVYINSTGIQYQTGWTTLSEIPSFVVVVTGGNIYIDKSVSQLDGIYVAKEAGGNGGTIYTCATDLGTLVDQSDLYNQCNTRLIVHGTFSAKHIALMRTGGTLEDAANANPALCVHASAPFKQSCAAEVFDFSPELYMSKPAIRPQSNGALHYDSIISLPPIL